MNVFIIKFNQIHNEIKLYNLLNHISSEINFIPFDYETFIIKTDYNKSEVISKLLQSVGAFKNFLLIDGSKLDKDSFFANNAIEQSAIEDFIQQAPKCKFTPNDCLSKKDKDEMIDSLLDNFNNLNEEEKEQLDKLSKL